MDSSATTAAAASSGLSYYSVATSSSPAPDGLNTVSAGGLPPKPTTATSPIQNLTMDTDLAATSVSGASSCTTSPTRTTATAEGSRTTPAPSKSTLSPIPKEENSFDVLRVSLHPLFPPSTSTPAALCRPQSPPVHPAHSNTASPSTTSTRDALPRRAPGPTSSTPWPGVDDPIGGSDSPPPLLLSVRETRGPAPHALVSVSSNELERAASLNPGVDALLAWPVLHRSVGGTGASGVGATPAVGGVSVVRATKSMSSLQSVGSATLSPSIAASDAEHAELCLTEEGGGSRETRTSLADAVQHNGTNVRRALLPIATTVSDPSIVTREQAVEATAKALMTLCWAWPVGSSQWCELAGILQTKGFPPRAFAHHPQLLLANPPETGGQNVSGGGSIIGGDAGGGGAGAAAAREFSASLALSSCLDVAGGVHLLKYSITAVATRLITQLPTASVTGRDFCEALSQETSAPTEVSPSGIIMLGASTKRTAGAETQSDLLGACQRDNFPTNGEPWAGEVDANRSTNLSRNPSNEQLRDAAAPGASPAAGLTVSTNFPELDLLHHYYGDSGGSQEGVNYVMKSPEPLSAAAMSESTLTADSLSLGRLPRISLLDHSRSSISSNSSASTAFSSPQIRGRAPGKYVRGPHTNDLHPGPPPSVVRTEQNYRRPNPLVPTSRDNVSKASLTPIARAPDAVSGIPEPWAPPPPSGQPAGKGRRGGSVPPSTNRLPLSSILSPEERYLVSSNYANVSFASQASSPTHDSFDYSTDGPKTSFDKQLAAFIQSEVEKRTAEMLQAKLEEITALATRNLPPGGLVRREEDGLLISSAALQQPGGGPRRTTPQHPPFSTPAVEAWTVNDNSFYSAEDMPPPSPPSLTPADRQSSLRRSRSDSCLKMSDSAVTLPVHSGEYDTQFFIPDNATAHHAAYLQRIEDLMKVVDLRAIQGDQGDAHGQNQLQSLHDQLMAQKLQQQLMSEQQQLSAQRYPQEHPSSNPSRMPRQGILKKRSTPLLGTYVNMDPVFPKSSAQPESLLSSAASIRSVQQSLHSVDTVQDRQRMVYFDDLPQPVRSQQFATKGSTSSISQAEQDISALARPLASFSRGLSSNNSMLPSMAVAGVGNLAPPVNSQHRNNAAPVLQEPQFFQKVVPVPQAYNHKPPMNPPVRRSSMRGLADSVSITSQSTETTRNHKRRPSAEPVFNPNYAVPHNPLPQRWQSTPTPPSTEDPADLYTRRRFGLDDSIDSNADAQSLRSDAASIMEGRLGGQGVGGSGSGIVGILRRPAGAAGVSGSGVSAGPTPRLAGSFSIGSGTTSKAAWLRKVLSRKDVVSVREL